MRKLDGIKPLIARRGVATTVPACARPAAVERTFCLARSSSSSAYASSATRYAPTCTSASYGSPAASSACNDSEPHSETINKAPLALTRPASGQPYQRFRERRGSASQRGALSGQLYGEGEPPHPRPRSNESNQESPGGESPDSRRAGSPEGLGCTARTPGSARHWDQQRQDEHHECRGHEEHSADNAAVRRLRPVGREPPARVQPVRLTVRTGSPRRAAQGAEDHALIQDPLIDPHIGWRTHAGLGSHALPVEQTCCPTQTTFNTRGTWVEILKTGRGASAGRRRTETICRPGRPRHGSGSARAVRGARQGRPLHGVPQPRRATLLGVAVRSDDRGGAVREPQADRRPAPPPWPRMCTSHARAGPGTARTRGGRWPVPPTFVTVAGAFWGRPHRTRLAADPLRARWCPDTARDLRHPQFDDNDQTSLAQDTGVGAAPSQVVPSVRVLRSGGRCGRRLRWVCGSGCCRTSGSCLLGDQGLASGRGRPCGCSHAERCRPA